MMNLDLNSLIEGYNINDKAKKNGLIGEFLGYERIKNFTTPKNEFKNRRAELFYTLLNEWNEDRKKAGFKPISKSRLASAIAINPFLKRDGELELLIKKCQEKGNYKYAHFVLFPKKTNCG